MRILRRPDHRVTNKRRLPETRENRKKLLQTTCRDM
jgi:hypothetical protein